jgi:hypothetical protein
MDVTFNFMTVAGNYRASIPDIFARRAAGSVITRGGISRTVAYLESSADNGGVLVGKRLIRQLKGQGNASVSVYEQQSPLLHLVFWQLSTGRVWTWASPAADGPDGAPDIAANLAVGEGESGLPRAEPRGSLGRGDLRRPDERDSVSFLSSDELAVNGSVSFVYAGSFSSDHEIFDGPRAIVIRRGTPGVDVVCDGPTGELMDLRIRASEVAATLNEL